MKLVPCPLQPAQPIPYGLVSLWDMINFNLHTFHLCMQFAKQSRDLGVLHPDKELTVDDVALTSDILGALESMFSRMNADAVLHWIRLIRNDLKRDNVTVEAVGRSYDGLIKTIEGSIENELFYHYPRDKAAIYRRFPDDWAQVFVAFKRCHKDIASAVDCYALGHNNASVYHSMMILERGLPALAKKLGAKIKKARPTWRDMTDVIRHKINHRRDVLMQPIKGTKSKSSSAAKREAELLGFSGEAALEFRFFEHAWRNHIAHARADYDENDAKKVLEHVRLFMLVLATKLKLKE